MVDLVDRHARRGLKQVDGQQSAAHGSRGAPAQVLNFISKRAIGGHPAAGGVGDPVGGGAVDGGDGFATDDEGADVTTGFINVFLNVEDLVVHAQHGFMLNEGLGRGAIIRFGEQAAPRADYGFEHAGVAHGVTGSQRGFFGEGHQDARGGDAGTREQLAGDVFIAATFGHLWVVDHGHAVGGKNARDVQSAGIGNGALKEDVHSGGGLVDGKEVVFVANHDHFHIGAGFKFLQEEFFFNAQAGV